MPSIAKIYYLEEIGMPQLHLSDNSNLAVSPNCNACLFVGEIIQNRYSTP